MQLHRDIILCNYFLNQYAAKSTSVDGYVEGAPELIVEIAASSASIDVHEKLKIYRRNQVREYLIWRVYDARLRLVLSARR